MVKKTMSKRVRTLRILVRSWPIAPAGFCSSVLICSPLVSGDADQAVGPLDDGVDARGDVLRHGLGPILAHDLARLLDA